jgi:hypothetical protein
MLAGGQAEGFALMPTNLPDPQKRKDRELEDTFTNAMFIVVYLAMVIATAMIVWLVWFARG